MADEHDEQHDDDQVVDDDQGAGEGAGTDDEPATLEAALELVRRQRTDLDEARKQAAANRRKARAAEGELEAARTQGLSDAERAVDEARKAGRDEAEGEWRDRYLREAVTAAAGGKMRDPDDAFGLLEATGALGDLRELEPDEMRGEARKRVDKLVEAKPYLAAEGGNGAGEGSTTGAITTGVRRRLEGRERSSSSSDSPNEWLRKAARRR